MLVAIAIPIFAAQLEKSREATDIANVRSAYAQVVAKYLTNADTSYEMTVTAKQTQSGWQGEDGVLMTQIDGVESSIAFGAKISGNTYKVSIWTTDSGSASVTVQ